MDIDWSTFRTLVDSHQRIVITSHIRPDADAIGSELGLAHLLESLGKTVRIVNASAMPASLQFLDVDRKVRQLGPDVSPVDLSATDLFCIVDTSAWQQLADVGKAMRATTVPRAVIDHHLSADDLGASEFKDVTRDSTGSLIAELHQAWGVTPTPAVADALYAAIATDTGWFRFPSTNPRTMRLVGWLMECGAKHDLIYRQLYEQISVARLHLAGRVLARVALECDGRLAYTHVKLEDFTETQAQAPDTEDLVNDCLRIGGTKAAFIAVELQNRHVKFSLRGRDDMDVAAVAEQFSGGGHRLAAGATLPPPFATALERMLEAMRNATESCSRTPPA